MAINDILRATIVGSIHEQTTENVLHFKATNNLGTPTDLINAIIGCIRTALLPGLSQEWKLVEVRARTIYPTATDDFVVSALSTDKGGLTDEALPSFVAAVISLKTGLAGRSNRGRMYIAGVGEGEVAASRLTSGELAALVAFAACLVSHFISSTSTDPFFLGVLSRKAVRGGSTIAAAFKEGQAMTVTNLLGTQRRRKIGVGA